MIHILDISEKQIDIPVTSISTPISSSDDNYFACNLCDSIVEKRFSTKAALLQHVRAKHSVLQSLQSGSNGCINSEISIGKEYLCPACGVGFQHESDVANHLNRGISPIDIRSFPCENCKREFTNERALLQHILCCNV
jgi:hypothetical protein